MKTYAFKPQAKKYIQDVFGVIVYVEVEDVPGSVGFKFPTRFIQPVAAKMRQLATDTYPYTFERATHYMVDNVQLDKHRYVRIKYTYGAAHAVIYLIDNEEAAPVAPQIHYAKDRNHEAQ